MRIAKIILSLAVSIALLALALHGVDPGAAWRRLTHAHVLPIIGCSTAFLAAYAMRGVRWGIMLRCLSPSPRFRYLISAIFIGGAANNLLPLRAGELVRSFAISKTSGISAASALSSIVLERVLDGLTLLALLAPLILSFSLPQWVSRVGFAAAILFLVAALLLVIAFRMRVRFTHRIESMLHRLHIKRTENIVRMLDRLQNGLGLFANLRDFALASAAGLIIWLLEAASYWYMSLALDLPLAPAAVFLCLVVVNMGLTLPSSPGFVGTFEYACVLAIAAFGIGSNAAIGFAILLHALFWIIIVAGGLAFAWIDHGGWKRLAGNYKTKAAILSAEGNRR